MQPDQAVEWAFSAFYCSLDFGRFFGERGVRLKVIPLTTKTPPFFQKEVYCGLNRRVFSVFIFFSRININIHQHV